MLLPLLLLCGNAIGAERHPYEERVAAIEASLGFELYDSGISMWGRNHPIYWLDDETLLFAGTGPEKLRTAADYRDLFPSLFLWSLGSPAHYYPAPVIENAIKGFGYCAEAGEIRYWRADDDADPHPDRVQWRTYIGRPGHEQPDVVASPRVRADNDMSRFARNDNEGWRHSNNSPVRCLAEPRTMMSGRMWLRDDDDRMYLDFGDFSEQSKARRRGEPFHLVDSADGRRIKLPITAAQSNEQCAVYDAANSRFVLWDCSANPIGTLPLQGCTTIWKIDKQTAEIDSSCLPAGPWSGRSISLIAARSGIFLIHYYKNDAKEIGDTGTAGLYRLRDGRVDRVLPGQLIQHHLSPNGCKLAFYHAWSPYDVHPSHEVSPRVRAVDLCRLSSGRAAKPDAIRRNDANATIVDWSNASPEVSSSV